MSEKTGTFLVTHADGEAVVLRDVTDGQVHTVTANPGIDERTVVEGTIAPEPPLEATWSVVEIENRRTIPVEETDLEPTRQSLDIAEDRPVGEVTRTERAGMGEVHVITVPGDPADAVADVLEDEATLERAARLGVDRVEVRSTDGVVSVRYLPDSSSH